MDKTFNSRDQGKTTATKCKTKKYVELFFKEGTNKKFQFFLTVALHSMEVTQIIKFKESYLEQEERYLFVLCRISIF